MNRVLVVDDYEPFRRFLSSTLQLQEDLRMVGEASDGVEAVSKAKDLQPELILLDIGLPKLNGIDAARKIRKLSPSSKILFVSQEISVDIVREALNTGAHGFVVKADAGSELLLAVEAVLRGEPFVGARFSGHNFIGRPQFLRADKGVPTSDHHEVTFCTADQRLLDHAAAFASAALQAGNTAVILATESHRQNLLSKLRVSGLNMGAIIEQGRYIPLDAAETLSTFMVNGMPDADRFLEAFGKLVQTTSNAATGEQRRVAVFGECASLLWAQGNAEGAIQMERLGNQLTKLYPVDVLCGYCLASVPGGMDSHVFEQICAEHSAIRGLGY